jgi:hypothetical protein
MGDVDPPCSTFPVTLVIVAPGLVSVTVAETVINPPVDGKFDGDMLTLEITGATSGWMVKVFMLFASVLPALSTDQ